MSLPAGAVPAGLLPGVLWLLLAPAESAAQASLMRVSVDSAGLESNSDSSGCALSADGRWVAFVSTADNLAAGDTNGQSDIYLHDRLSGTTRRVSVSSTGAQGNAECAEPSLSADGRLIAFQSDADTLVPGDTNGFADVFVHDRVLRTTVRVSLGAHDNQASLPCMAPRISPDGSAVAFQSYAIDLAGPEPPGVQDVFVRDLVHGTTACISRTPAGSPASGSSWAPSFSADGSLVVFYSQASNLVPQDTNGAHDVFVHDRRAGVTELVSLNSFERQGDGPSTDGQLSADGRFVVFSSDAHTFFEGDDNNNADVFVRDRLLGRTELISRNSVGVPGNEASDAAAISGDGRWVVFHSDALNLAEGHDSNHTRDIFLRDRLLQTTVRLSVGPHSLQGDSTSQRPAISVAGDLVAFESHAQNLIAGDVNRACDVFVRTLD